MNQAMAVTSTARTLLAFARARDVLGFESRVVVAGDATTARELILGVAPDFFEKLGACRVALDCDYADWSSPIGSAREVALIPPVSGG